MARGTEIVAAIAQQPFWLNDNQFVTVRPIAVIENERLGPVREGDYPNRELCWWLIRGISPQQELVPGRLIVGRVEEAAQFDPKDSDKDKFQFEWDSVRLGGLRNVIEIVDGPKNLDRRDLINRANALELDHPPTSLILVRLGERIYGPFKAEWEYRGRYLITLFKPQSSLETTVFDAARVQKDPGFITRHRILLSACDQPLNKSIDTFSPSYHILTWERFEALQQNEALERIRLYSDDEVVRQVAKQVLPRKRLRDFMQEWKDVSQVYLTTQDHLGPNDVVDVFKFLNTRLTGQTEAVEELVESILDSGVLENQIERAITNRARLHIETHTAKLSAEVEEKINNLRQQEQDLIHQIGRLTNDLERRRRQEEAQLEADLQQQRLGFEQWKATENTSIEQARADIAQQRQILEEGLKEVAARFVNNRQELLKDFLSMSPFLTQIGVLTANANEYHASTATEKPSAMTAPPPLLEPPAFLKEISSVRGLEKEEAFFNRFKEHVANAGFRFRPLDLVAFHLSVKCGDLTILGGYSGTGKSSLPVLYAQALAGDESRYLAVDVSPSWLEPGDLLGRANLLEEKFQPAATGLFEHLVWAAMETERNGRDSGLWMICLDEMNLAQPEHYFSGFLQALPRAGQQRSVGVFSPSAVCRADPWREWARIPLNSNLRFIGTVNYDETTKPLSQRLRDRANELRLEAVPFGSLQRTASTSSVTPPSGAPVTVASFDSWTCDMTLTGQAASVIDAMQQPLAVLGSPLTPRRYQAIARFVASAGNLCSAEEAFDMQLRQRVLSQVRGIFRAESRRALDDLRSILENHGSTFSGALQLLERIAAESAQAIDFDAFEVDA
ncbi:hypothetical protein [Chromatium okenii]|uniref:AAA+ ATPase domain-containing protein n=1 Tax=Chromatium okenii TaxID=61644 RepID=A0A2S7XTP2_9GAMM|nr:hypothetical protein [Chromatium okenii]PQJ97107.1 hypothetical protein CXB77_03825 [Chromatium okenii]